MSERDIFPSDLVGQLTIAHTEELTKRVCLAFAAGVNDLNPYYFDDARPTGLIGHPGLVFALQWHSHWTPGRPYDFNAPFWRRGRLMHAGADARFARALRLGDVITTQGRTVAVRRIKPGVFWLQRYVMVDQTGAIVAELDHSLIVRDAEVDGPDRDESGAPPLPEVPAAASDPAWSAEIPIARNSSHIYAECADIWTPFHTERAQALAAGLPDIILYGSETMTVALREVINRDLAGDPTRLARFAGQFRALVIPGHPLTIRARARRPRADGGVEIFFDALNHEGAPAISGGVIVGRPPS